MNSIFVIILAGLVSYALRAGMILLADRWEPPAGVTRATSLIGPAAFAALAATAIAGHIGAGAAASLPLVGGIIVAGSVAHRTGSANTALVVGLPAVWLLSAVL